MSVRFILAVVLLLVTAPLSGQDPAGAAPVWGDIADEWRTAICHWASITKTFTAIAIMQLRDRGLPGFHLPLGAQMAATRRRTSSEFASRSVCSMSCSLCLFRADASAAGGR
jgi:hypothetical protein